MYEIEDEMEDDCDHSESITLCVYCGKVLDEGPTGTKTSTSSSETIYLETSVEVINE